MNINKPNIAYRPCLTFYELNLIAYSRFVKMPVVLAPYRQENKRIVRVYIPIQRVGDGKGARGALLYCHSVPFSVIKFNNSSALDFAVAFAVSSAGS